MTGLKVVTKDPTGHPTEDVCPDGYIAVTEALILAPAPQLAAFLAASKGDRADILRNIAQPGCAVTTLDRDWEIDHDNCEIKVEADEDLDGDKIRKKVNKKAKHTLPMPPGALSSLHYLDEYILALSAFVYQGELDKARKFLYGVMMMTKCR